VTDEEAGKEGRAALRGGPLDGWGFARWIWAQKAILKPGVNKGDKVKAGVRKTMQVQVSVSLEVPAFDVRIDGSMAGQYIYDGEGYTWQES
jgi:hypothetical protein